MKKTLAALGCLALSVSFAQASDPHSRQFDHVYRCTDGHGLKRPNRQIVFQLKSHLSKMPDEMHASEEKLDALSKEINADFDHHLREGIAGVPEHLHGTTDLTDELRTRFEQIDEKYSARPDTYLSTVLYDAFPREGCGLPDDYKYKDFKEEHAAYMASAEAIEAQKHVDTRDSYMNVCNASHSNQTITKYRIDFANGTPETVRTAFREAMVKALQLETKAIHEAYMPHTARGMLYGTDAALYIQHFKNQIARHRIALQKQYNLSVTTDVDIPAVAAGCGLNAGNQNPAQNYREAKRNFMYAGHLQGYIGTPVMSLDDLFSRLKISNP